MLCVNVVYPEPLNIGNQQTVSDWEEAYQTALYWIGDEGVSITKEIEEEIREHNEYFHDWNNGKGFLVQITEID